MNDSYCPDKKDDETEVSTILSEADSKLLRYYLENPPDPSPALKAAYNKVTRISSLNENGEVVYNVEGLVIDPPRDHL